MVPGLQRLNIRIFMAVYLAAVLLVGAWGTAQAQPLLHAVMILVLYVSGDLLWTWFREKTLYHPLSSLLSGLVGAIVLAPASPLWVVVLFPLIAVVLKQLLQWRGKHVFNPAAASLVVLSLLFPPVISWWAVAWWPTTLNILGILVGLVVLARIRRFAVAIPFLVVYTVGLGLTLLAGGVTLLKLLPLVFDGTLIFFASVMLVEPVTTAYRTTRIQLLYGAGVGLLAVLAPFSGLPLPDGLLPPLLIGNLLASCASIRRRVRAPSLPALQPTSPACL